MYSVHPSEKLIQIFSQKPYQGCSPTEAEFLFIGLDANYAPDIEEQTIFPKIIEYHEDAISFWQKYGVHHPFLLDEYKGDGRKYHKEFSKIRLSCKDASRISFIELLHLPTTGRSNLKSSDLDKHHLHYINQAIFSEHTKAVFISDAVFKLMKKTSIFSWMNDAKQIEGHALKVFHEKEPLIYKHLHFSTYGKFQVQKEAEMKAIHSIILGSNTNDLT
jgi:hypothetical protein